jgi:hypothetical protein
MSSTPVQARIVTSGVVSRCPTASTTDDDATQAAAKT